MTEAHLREDAMTMHRTPTTGNTGNTGDIGNSGDIGDTGDSEPPKPAGPAEHDMGNGRAGQTEPTEQHRQAIQTAANRLRTALRVNAGFSAATGLAAAAAGGPIASAFDIEPSWIVHGLGVGLLAFAATLIVSARRPTTALPSEAALISAADLGWVVGTAVVVAFGWLSTTGVVVMGLTALVVLDLAIAQLWTRRRLLQALAHPRS